MAEPERKCSTCKFYEPAPIWRKGWCRNPLLYAPQQSHLVAEDDLDCSRGLSDYWEAGDGTGPNAGVNLAMSGRDPFGQNKDRGERGNPEPTADPWNSSQPPYGDGRNAPMPDDDGYAPHESAPPIPTTGPRYAGAAGAEDDVRNPWDNSQPGYGAPPTRPEDDPNQGRGYGYGTDQQEQNPWQTPPPPNAYGQGEYGQEQPGYGQGGYEQEQPQGYPPGAYGGYGPSGYNDQGGYQQPPNAPPISAGVTGSGQRRIVPTPAATGKERSLSYYTEERYWTDYAKLIVPVVILVVILAIGWFVGANKLRGGNSSATATPNSTTVAASAAASTRTAGGSAVVGGSVRPGTTAVGTTGAGVITPSGVAGIAPNGQATLPAGTARAGTPGANTGTTAGSGQPGLPVRRFTVSAGGSGANMRTNPDTKSNPPIATIPDGTEVQVVDGPQNGADGIPWYKVSAGDKTGWIRSDFLKPVTP